jgi:tetratricopeptide (TPR) repeat protein
LVVTLSGRRQYLMLALAGVLSLAVIVAAGFFASRYVAAERHYRAAEAALQRHDFKDAENHLAEYLKVWPSSSEAHFLAARTARRATAYDEADEHLKAAQRLGGVPEAIDLERALMRVQRGEFTKQLEDNLLYDLQNDHPDSVLILEALSRGYLRTYQLVKVEHCLKSWLEREPDSVQALLWMAEAHTYMQGNQRALEDYEKVLKIDPERDEARLQVAETLIRRHQAGEALPHFQRLHERQPRNVEVLVGLARCYRQLDKPQETAQSLEEALRLAPGNVDAQRERGRLAQDQGQVAEAVRWLRQVVAVAPYDREATFILAQSLQQLGKGDEAAAYFKKVDEIDSKIKHLEEVTRQIAKAPHDPALRHEAGKIFLESGQPIEGLRWLHSALQEDPSFGPTRRTLVDYYDGIGDTVNAARHRAYLLRPPRETPSTVGKTP